MRITSVGINPINFNGWHPIKPENTAQIDKVNQALSDPSIKRVAVSGHNFPDADSIGACFATAYILNAKLNQPIDVYIFGKVPKKLKYLQDPKIINVIEITDSKYYYTNEIKPYDIAVSVDTSDHRLMDMDYYRDIFSKAKTSIKIDHHKTPEKLNKNLESAVNYADINFVDSTCPSAAELAMQLTKPLGLNPKKLHPHFNNAVYVGILGDTGNFAYTTNSQPFYDTALLIKNGLNPERAQHRTLSKISKEAYEILSLAKSKIKFYKSGNIAFLYLDEELVNSINKIKKQEEKSEIEARIKTLVTGMRDVEGVEVTVLIKPHEDKPNHLHFSVRSATVNIRKFAQNYGGGGHDKASGFIIPEGKKAEYTTSNILKELQKVINAQINPQA